MPDSVLILQNIDEVVFRCIKEEVLIDEPLRQEHFEQCRLQTTVHASYAQKVFGYVI